MCYHIFHLSHHDEKIFSDDIIFRWNIFLRMEVPIREQTKHHNAAVFLDLNTAFLNSHKNDRTDKHPGASQASQMQQCRRPATRGLCKAPLYQNSNCALRTIADKSGDLNSFCWLKQGNIPQWEFYSLLNK